MADDPVAAHYDALADLWDEHIAQGATRQHVLWPALDDLLPSVDGRRVLDAGCGTGYFSAVLADRGATVTGLDVSEEMVAAAREAYGDVATFETGDVTDLAYDDDAFDVVLCQHVLSHLPDVAPAFEAFARVLAPGGSLVCSTHHPFHDYLVVRDQEHPDASDALDMDLDPVVVTDIDQSVYGDAERYEVHWNGADSEHPGVYYRRSLAGLLDPLLAAGLSLEGVVEPTPDDAFAEAYPDLAAVRRERLPESLCLRADL